MRKPKKESISITCKLEKSISEKLDAFCEETKMTKTATIEKALEQYINEYEKNKK